MDSISPLDTNNNNTRRDKNHNRKNNFTTIATATATTSTTTLVMPSPATMLSNDPTWSINTTTTTTTTIATTKRTTPYRYRELNSNQEQSVEDCSITVVLTDPRIPYFPANDTLYTKTLESIAEYLPSTACIVLQTSICQLEQCLLHLPHQQITPDFLCYSHDETSSSSSSSGNRDPNQPPKPIHQGFHPNVFKLCGKPMSRPRSSRTKTNNNNINSTKTHPSTTTTTNTNANTNKSDTSITALLLAESWIQQRSGPLLQQNFWNRGRIRISILDHNAYHFAACDAFVSINSAFLSTKYWIQEFIPQQDSDLVLILQRDVFLCKPFTLHTWQHFAYVGAPWFQNFQWIHNDYPIPNKKKGAIWLNHQSDDKYSIKAWRKYWKRLDQHYTTHRNHPQDHYHATTITTTNNYNTTINCSTMEAQVNHVHCPLPSLEGLSFPTELPTHPRGNSRWVGNGGFSIRSRKWLIRMIRLCPKEGSWSHLPSSLLTQTTKTTTTNNNHTNSHNTSFICRVIAMQEDMFFSLMLTLTGANIAPYPQASFFGTDQDFGWPSVTNKDIHNKDETKTITNVAPQQEQQQRIHDWLGHEAWTKLQQEKNTFGHYIPIGQHKCYRTLRQYGYGCIPQQYCKYSFNENNQSTNMWE